MNPQVVLKFVLFRIILVVVHLLVLKHIQNLVKHVVVSLLLLALIVMEDFILNSLGLLLFKINPTFLQVYSANT